MADQPGKEQMMKFLAPAAAVAVVIVLVGVLLATWGNPDTTAPDKGKGLPSAAPAGDGKGNSVPVDTEGLTLTKPPEDAPEWKDVGDGLKVWDVKEGSGAACPERARVIMHYTGWTLGGTIFDSSVQKNDPLNYSLTGLIAGWQQGVPGMKIGGIRRLYIPWKLAYGANGDGGKIPPKADLIFEIKLFSFS